MEFDAFKSAHPEIVQMAGWAFLLALVVFCFRLWRMEVTHATHEERHHHYGSLMLWLILGSLAAFVLYIMWLLYHKDVWLWLHQVLS